MENIFAPQNNAYFAENSYKPLDHKHNPGMRQSGIMRFFEFLFHPKKLYLTTDDTGVCAICRCYVRVPDAYYHDGIKIANFFLGVGIMLAGSLLVLKAGLAHLWFVILGKLFALIVNHIINSFVLALGHWVEFDKNNVSLVSFEETAKSERKKRDISFACGVLPVGCFWLIYALTHMW